MKEPPADDGAGSLANPPGDDRDRVGDDRDRTADDRDRTSEALDDVSEARDVRSDARDLRADARDQARGRFDAKAASDRAGAKRDRQGSAGDRTHARHDRAAAYADRSVSARERAALVVDALTGAYRRDSGLVELEREIVMTRRTGQPFVLAFVDVDDLKARNDSEGHAAGDELLRQVAETIRGTVREYDLVVRFGGDEFLCGLVGFDLAEAAERFETSKSQLAARGASISVGLAELGAAEDLEALIMRADAAMYEDRRARAQD